MKLNTTIAAVRRLENSGRLPFVEVSARHWRFHPADERGIRFTREHERDGDDPDLSFYPNCGSMCVRRLRQACLAEA